MYLHMKVTEVQKFRVSVKIPLHIQSYNSFYTDPNYQAELFFQSVLFCYGLLPNMIAYNR
jgi:hypothetical protein